MLLKLSLVTCCASVPNLKSHPLPSAAFGNFEERTSKYGLSGRSPQDAFTVACSLTHRRFWEMMVARNIQVAVVLESDAVYAKLGEGDAESAVREVLRSASAADPAWELVNLGRCDVRAWVFSTPE